jgi:transposase InsO family protein
LTLAIERIVLGSKRTYGSPRVHAVLKGMGMRCSKKTVAEIMKDNNLLAKTKRKFKVTTDSQHKHQVAPNLLNRDFSPAGLNQVWAGDITYIRTGEGWLYLAVVMDLYSRKIVGWKMSNRMSRDLVIGAMRMALTNRQPPRGLIFHSDRGSQYASADFKRVLWAAGVVQSMSGKGACWDNAVVESFFKTLKTEYVYYTSFKTRSAAESKIFSWIEITYNRARLHSTLGYKTPIDYEEGPMAKIA